MKLIRGWERRYLPSEVGGLRLSKAKVYRKLGEEEGIGDVEEGQFRASLPASVEISNPSGFSSPMTFTIDLDPEQPPIVVEDVTPGERREFPQNVRMNDSALDSPFLFCLSREPKSKNGWDSLNDALPARYEAWTSTDNPNALRFEIEWGIKRWLALQGITRHSIVSFWGWVVYQSDDSIPVVSQEDVGAILESRWLRKRRRYKDQQEYRMGWLVSSDQWEDMPNKIDIELTKTGLGLFKPWEPPE